MWADVLICLYFLVISNLYIRGRPNRRLGVECDREAAIFGQIRLLSDPINSVDCIRAVRLETPQVPMSLV